MSQLSGRIVSEDNEFQSQIGHLLRASAIPVTPVVGPIRRESAPPDLVVADIRGDATAAMVSIEQLRSWAPQACIIAVAESADPNLILRAMRSGVNEFLTWPPSDESFGDATEDRDPVTELDDQRSEVEDEVAALGLDGSEVVVQET